MTTAKARRYDAAVKAMVRAAREWQFRNLHALVQLNKSPPGLPLPPGKKVALIGTLAEAVPWLGANEETRELLRTIDRASGGEATILMAQAALVQVFGEPS